MKKINFLFILFFLTVCGLHAQTNLYFSDFETYTAGGKIALQAGTPWTTWSNEPGGSEDAIISTAQAHSGANSIYISDSNDLVFNLNDRITGRYKVEWNMFVETDKIAYFNLLSSFEGSSSKYAIQVYVYNDSLFVDAGGAYSAKLPYQLNSWKKIQIIVDLNDDFATFYVDSNEVISYKWSGGVYGVDNSLKLDAVDFYGWDGSGSSAIDSIPGYYIDDFSFDSVVAPESSSNLTAVLNTANIQVSWTAPTVAPDSYKLSRNGIVVNSTSGLTYTDLNPWPNTYTYAVRAHYIGEGYSHSSNDTTLVVTGGVSRNLVLMEGGTGTWCGYCPGAAIGLRDLIEVNHKNAAAIEYHYEDNYETPATLSRLSYYGIDNYPTVIADGKLRAEGGSATQSQYSRYLPMYNERIAYPAFDIINLTVTPLSTDSFSASITVEQTFAAFTSGIKLHTALTESNIPFAWGNQTKVDFACRGMYPSANGTNLDFSNQNTQTVTVKFSTAGFVKNNCEFVVFVQHNSSKEVFQTMKVDMSSVLGIEEIQGKSINLYPNPASDNFMLLTDGKGNVDIFDISGKLLSSAIITNPTQFVDVSNLSKGVYFVKVTNSIGSYTKKLVVE
ncbi:MAG: T9SS type A sorting domain-containing protein [Bacteroidetes bacterium]|nr:T9SS type A sorting domain-containing protein [Bacteroidota bacterium]